MEPAIVQVLARIAQALQAHFWPGTVVEWAQLVLVLLTGGTLVFLIKYTNETVKLRKAAMGQVAVGNQLLRESEAQTKVSQQLLREAQTQNESAVRPTLLFVQTERKSWLNAPQNRWYHYYEHEIRNAGRGVAFNVEWAAVPTVSGVVNLQGPNVVTTDVNEMLSSVCEGGMSGNMLGLVGGIAEGIVQLPTEVVTRYRDVSGKV